jgi:hypothetical protein
VRSDTSDSLLTRLRLERLLSAVDWQPTSLPANAILCIRKASDPLPNSFSLSASSPGSEWQQALTSMLNRFASQAVRPLTNSAPSNSDAVVFLDEAELLACLAADWCRGSLTTNWWWQGILGDRDLAAVLKLWSEKPQFVPAALHHLAKIDLAVSFVRQLSGATVRQLAQTVAHSFGATALWQLLEVERGPRAFSEQIPEDIFEGVASTDHGPSVVPANTRDSVTVNPPWHALVSETDSVLLSPEQQRFLGVSLMIYRASSQARSRDFARAVERWQSSINRESRNFSTHSVAKMSPTQDAARSVHDSVAGRVSAEVETREAKREVVFEKSATELISFEPVLPEAVSPSSTTNSLPSEPVPSRVEELKELRAASSESSADGATLSQSETLPATTIDPESFEGPAIDFETQLGGLFYLINLGVYLELYADFTAPLTPGIELNIWDFVTLVGSELVEGAYDDDPIWAALANLAGRDETEPPGANFEPDDELHSKGLRHWLSLLMPNVRARLRVALGLKTDDQIPEVLCCHHARVCITDTHVDVYFGLADLPLAIRFAGLDRDPGWIPAAGRFIRFHFD